MKEKKPIYDTHTITIIKKKKHSWKNKRKIMEKLNKKEKKIPKNNLMN